MAMKIVTGYTGEPHITSNDDAALYRAIIGTDYVLPNGSEFAHEIISNNCIRVKDGDILIQGHLGRIVPADFQDLTINNGTQGMKRYDLIVARYEKASGTGIESITLKVIEGTPASNPISPVVTVQDLSNGGTIREVVLYRVEIDGLSITGVTKLFKSSLTLEDWKIFKESGGIFPERTGFSKGLKLGDGDAIISEAPDSHGNSDRAIILQINGVGVQCSRSGFHSYDQDLNLGSQWIPWLDVYLKGIKWATSGYTKLPNEMILQWGEYYKDIPGVYNGWIEEPITFPITFPKAYLSCTLSLNLNQYDKGKITHLQRISDDGGLLNRLPIRYYVTATGNTTVKVNWFAIGY